MKIYHTEKQADYDALMVELEAQGFMWSFGRKLSESNNWHVSEHLTCIRVYDSEVDYASLNYYKEEYSHIPITKYKAKVNEMRFTKKNVLNLTDKWIENKTVSFQELQNQIKELDDTPEKVVVPKFVAEWIESFTDITSSYSILEAFMCSYNKIVLPSELYNYYDNNENGARDKVISAILSGYEVENEPLYHVATKDGKLMLFKYENVVSVTPAPVVMTIKDYGHKPYYQLTETEIKNYDERYWPFAVPVKEEQQ